MNNDCIANMKALIAKYNTPVMMCEIGISWDYEEAEAFYTRLRYQSQTSRPMSGSIYLGTSMLR